MEKMNDAPCEYNINTVWKNMSNKETYILILFVDHEVDITSSVLKKPSLQFEFISYFFTNLLIYYLYLFMK